MTQSTLVLLRHGQSAFNALNLFTGWINIGLSQQGVQEAIDAAHAIGDIPIHMVFTSDLIRAQHTAAICMSTLGIPLMLHEHITENNIVDAAFDTCIPLHYDSRLNERHYGDLQGKNKAETIAKYGKEQVHLWRRSFDIKPPNGESLADTYNRVIPALHSNIIPTLCLGKNVLVVAHGNSIRAIIKYIENVSDNDINNIEVHTGTAITYTYDLDTKRFVL